MLDYWGFVFARSHVQGCILVMGCQAVMVAAIFFFIFQSFKATRNFSVSDWSKNFEVIFQDEEGELSCDYICRRSKSNDSGVVLV